MSATESIRQTLRSARRGGARWVRMIDAVRDLASSTGRARLWTRVVHGRSLHQLTEYTEAERYPELFDMVAALRPGARRILSFGCSTGEELESLRRRFPHAELTGVEINPRSRREARRRTVDDQSVTVAGSIADLGEYDVVFALAVLQYKPKWVEEERIDQLAPFYPFGRFDREIGRLAGLLKPGGLLCVMHSHYRVEDSSVSSRLQPRPDSPPLSHPIFAPDGARLPRGATGASIFVKADTDRQA